MTLIGDHLSAHPRVLFLGKHASDIENWGLRVFRDDFSGDVRCRMRSKDGRILYLTDAFGFRFGSHADVMGAWVKIEGGNATRWREMFPELARLRVEIDGRNLDSPTDGIVWIPASKLRGVQKVAIQPRTGARAQEFSLQGFDEMHQRALAEGCTAEARFIR